MSAEPEPFYVLDMKAWPLVHVAFTHAPEETAEFDMFQETFMGMLKGIIEDQTLHGNTDTIALVMELDGIVKASFMQQLRGIGFIQAIKPFVAQTIRCTALVITSDIVRAIVQFIMERQPLQSEHALFEDVAAAMEWCKSRVDV